MSTQDFQYNVIDEHRYSLLKKLGFIRNLGFYLAGGTGLALILGHRDSIDFDFFRPKAFDPDKLFQELKHELPDYHFTKIMSDRDTLTILVDETIQLSFFGYDYELLEPLVSDEIVQIASVADIAAMKCSAVVGRATNKDYIDLYVVLQTVSLETLLGWVQQKLPDLDVQLVLKSLVYFEDLDNEPLNMIGGSVDFDGVKKFLETTVLEYLQ